MLMIVALALADFHPFGGGQISTRQYLIPAWRIRVAEDRFIGARRCLLYQGRHARPDVSYRHGAVVFRFAPKLDTTAATLKIDGGTARPWTAYYPQLVDTGVRLEGRSLDNPTGGEVMLPLRALDGASSVTIRPTPQSRPKLFNIGGLGDALRSAHTLGCETDTAFGR